MKNSEQTKPQFQSVDEELLFYKKRTIRIGAVAGLAVILVGAGFFIMSRRPSVAVDSSRAFGSLPAGERPSGLPQGRGQGGPQGGGPQGGPPGGGQMSIANFVNSDGSIKEDELKNLISNIPSEFQSQLVSRFTEDVQGAESDGTITKDQGDQILSIISNS